MTEWVVRARARARVIDSWSIIRLSCVFLDQIQFRYVSPFSLRINSSFVSLRLLPFLMPVKQCPLLCVSTVWSKSPMISFPFFFYFFLSFYIFLASSLADYCPHDRLLPLPHHSSNSSHITHLPVFGLLQLFLNILK